MIRIFMTVISMFVLKHPSCNHHMFSLGFCQCLFLDQLILPKYAAQFDATNIQTSNNAS